MNKNKNSDSNYAHRPPWLIALILANLILGLLLAIYLRNNYREIDRAAEIRVRNYTRLISSDLDQLFSNIDVAVRAISAELHTGEADNARRLEIVNSVAQKHPEFRSLTVHDQNGDYVGGHLAPDGVPFSIAVGGLLNLLKKSSGEETLVVGPGKGPSNNRWSLGFVRRINAPDGSFAGAVLTGYATERLEEKFADLELNASDAIVIRSANKAVVARYPATFPLKTGSTELPPPVAEAMMQAPKSGFVHRSGKGMPDDADRMFSYDHTTNYGFLVIVSTRIDQVFSAFYRQAAALSVLLFLVWLSSFLTARRSMRAEAQIRQGSNRLKSILSTTLDGYWAIDHQGRLVDANMTYAQQSGYSRAELLNHPVGEFDSLLDDASTKALIKRLREESRDIFESIHRRKDGSLWNVEVSAIDDGEQINVFIRDVTARRRAEEEIAQRLADIEALNQKLLNAQNQLLQSEKMSSIGQLAAGVAHEINNPIGFVRSNLSTLTEYVNDLLTLIDQAESCVESCRIPGRIDAYRAMAEKLDLEFLRGDVHQLLAQSIDGAERVRRIVQNLRDFSHVSEEEWQWADLQAGLESTVQLVWNEIKFKAELARNFSELPKVYCIAAQINQVFLNLLVNAAQAIETAGTITLSTGVINAENGVPDHVWIEIADSGTGIAPAHLSRIFEPFFTTKPVGKGTGLGLSLAWSIVEKHHGELSVDSNPGAGTRFRLILPVSQTPESPPESSQ